MQEKRNNTLTTKKKVRNQVHDQAIVREKKQVFLVEIPTSEETGSASGDTTRIFNKTKRSMLHKRLPLTTLHKY